MFRALQIRVWISVQFPRQIIIALGILLFAATAFSAQHKQPPATPVHFNVATVSELEQLPGVGPTTAKTIVDFRTKSGRFHRAEDLLVICGIPDAKLKKMRPYVIVGPPPARKLSPPANKPPGAPAQSGAAASLH